MRSFRRMLLAACAVAVPLAVAAGAKAANPSEQGVVLYNAAGVPVAILTPLRGGAPAAQPADPAAQMIREIESASAMDEPMFPFAQLMAQQDQMLRQVMQEMSGLMRGVDAFGRGGMVEAAMPGMPITGGQGAQELVISSFSSGRGSCSQTVTYNFASGGAQPQVSVRKVGDACGAVDAPTTRSIPAAQRLAPEQAAPSVPTAAPAARTYNIEYLPPARVGVSRDLRG